MHLNIKQNDVWLRIYTEIKQNETLQEIVACKQLIKYLCYVFQNNSLLSVLTYFVTKPQHYWSRLPLLFLDLHCGAAGTVTFKQACCCAKQYDTSTS